MYQHINMIFSQLPLALVHEGFRYFFVHGGIPVKSITIDEFNKLPKAFKKKKSVGIRVPNNNITLEIVRELGNPIVSTSIYDEDEIIEYTTDPELILEKWNKLVELVIDGGYGDNEPSTIIDLSEDEPSVIREGKGSLDIL